MDKTLVSIVVVTENDQENLTITIESILRQTYSNFEIIIFDNASTDQTLSIAKSYEDDQIKIVPSTKQNVLSCVNEAISLAQGASLVVFPSDGIMKVDFIESMLTIFKQNKTVNYAAAQYVQVDSDGVINDYPILPTSRDGLIIECLISSRIIKAPIMIKSSSTLKNGRLYNLELKMPQLEALWPAVKSNALVASNEYIAAFREKKLKPSQPKTDTSLWSKRYGALPRLSHFHNTINGFEGELQQQFLHSFAKLYLLALKKMDYFYALLLFMFVMARPGFRHEFLNIVKKENNI